MDDLVIELILIAMILVPAIATSLQPARAVNRSCYCGRLGNARRGN
ncbi:MAG: hypothetical protein WB341_09010 [Terracidiphilus sp.]